MTKGTPLFRDTLSTENPFGRRGGGGVGEEGSFYGGLGHVSEENLL